jgi:hypothetical protein
MDIDFASSRGPARSFLRQLVATVKIFLYISTVLSIINVF